ncbi:lipase secretion chaperone [Pyxidicoccus xibeiensis]|uniref:lipase secretion chaperone n=1 Tax=Pyxidicoccus xibeiensis TaxID=2906759 RepID=UPI0020A74ECF|nr:lipase secretion chaperone [Pyxidicoccus xibeiensis]MCP3136246.1 lipase chaperone [Pyxidicoccus xibeiensis]
MKTRIAIVLLVAVCMGGGARGWLAAWSEDPSGSRAFPDTAALSREDLARPASGDARPRAGADTETGSSGDAAQPRGDLPSRPTSLQDTEEDGALRVDASGHLVPSADVRLLFDYYLSASGEEPPEVLRARIVSALRAKLPPAAVEEAVRLLDDYLAYREATRTLQAPPGSAPDDLGSRLEAVRRLRREHLGDTVADAFFGADELLDGVALERLRLERDTSLTPEERERRITALEERLPASMQVHREEALRPLRQQAEERELLATGATAEDLRHYRRATVGEEATARLEALDQRRSEWKRRLAAFRAKREALRLAEPDLALREAAVQRLLIDSFTPEERPRVEAADALEAERAVP